MDSPGVVSSWLPGPPSVINAITNPFGRARSVRRGALDRSLAEQAARSGVVVAQEHSFVAASRCNPGWEVTFACGRDVSVVCADFLVDATGRRATVAQRLGATVARDDSLTAFVAWIGPQASLSDSFRMLHIEAVEGGWWAAIGLPGDVLSLSFFTPLAAMRRRRLRVSSLWKKALSASRMVAPLLPETAWQPTRVQAFPAAPALTRPPFGSDWLAAGDAAAQFDPLQGRGVQRALELAFRASEAIQLERPERDRILAAYADTVAAWHTAHLRERMSVYEDAFERLGEEFLSDLAQPAPGSST
jgi:flavin-dependent dehydrogenase